MGLFDSFQGNQFGGQNFMPGGQTGQTGSSNIYSNQMASLLPHQAQSNGVSTGPTNSQPPATSQTISGVPDQTGKSTTAAPPQQQNQAPPQMNANYLQSMANQMSAPAFMTLLQGLSRATAALPDMGQR